MDLKISGKWALVTGGANGIGASITEALAKEGVNIVITSRSKECLNQMQLHLKKYPTSLFRGIEIDFLEKDWEKSFEKQIKGLKIDILVNNAGHTLDITDPYCSIAEWRKVMQLNFELAVYMSNMFIPNMKQQSWGRIVNITSCSGLENMGPVTYGVSKAALTAYTRTMGRILATENPNVVMTAVFPGVVLTKNGHWDKVLQQNPEHAEQYLKERCPLGRFGEPSEISPVVLFYCSELASFSHGAIVPVDAGQSRHYMYYNYLV